MNIAFIGGGNMSFALIGGLLRQGYSPGRIRVVEIDAGRRERIRTELGVASTAELAEGVAGSDVVLLAVKPQQLAPVARALAPLLERHLVVSIAAGIRAMDIGRWLGGHERVVRAMPNTPALVQAGVTGLYALAGVDAEQRHAAETILGAVGSVLWCQSEELLDAVTAVSGSGPAYVFYFMEALQAAGQTLGLDADQARQLTLDTFLGAARLASDGGDDPAALRARVTSRGGTTERAIQALDDGKVREAILHAARAASLRSRELGDQLGEP